MKTKEPVEKDLITKESTIGEVIMSHPEVVPKLLEFGVHCIGCHVAASESIKDGLTAHGFSEEQIDKMVKEMNDVVKNKKTEEKKSNDSEECKECKHCD
ncbi:MAG: DUF1858 domain-containing protein [Candidatus Micrarchaeota archaeon]